MHLRQTTKCTKCMWLKHMGFSGGKLNHYAGNRRKKFFITKWLIKIKLAFTVLDCDFVKKKVKMNYINFGIIEDHKIKCIVLRIKLFICK